MFNKVDEKSRRDFMVSSAASFLGVTMLPMLGNQASAATEDATEKKFVPKRPKAAKSVIFLNMNGGMSHLDTFDPKEKKEVMGETQPLQTSAEGVKVGHWLPKTAEIMHHVVSVNSLSTQQGAHRQAQYMLTRSYSPRGTIVHPVLGSWVLRLSGKRNSTIPGFVQVGTRDGTSTSGFLGPKYAAVPVADAFSGIQDISLPGGITQEDFERRLRLAEAMNKNFKGKFDHKKVSGYENLYRDAVDLMRAEDLKAFDISDEDSSTQELYGSDRFGQACLLARRLVEHDVRFVQVNMGGWDTHYDNFTRMEENCARLDQGFSALITDLDRRGMLDETVVALGTDFGRTPKIVEHHQNGRDHYPKAFTQLLAGGGIQGGQTYGRTDSKGMEVDDKPVSPQMFNATIAHAMGLPAEQIIYSPTGRPFTVADKAKAITEIF